MLLNRRPFPPPVSIGSIFPMAAVVAVGALLALTVSLPALAQVEPTAARIDAIVAEMAKGRDGFDPETLDAMGAAGLSAVLDRLLPGTADLKKLGISAEKARRLVGKLGDEQFHVRQTASAALVEMGPAIRPMLVAAARADDAEVAWRARQVLRLWETQQHEDKTKYHAAFALYVATIDDAPRLREMARRSTRALAGGVPPPDQVEIVRQCLGTLGRAGKAELLAELKPLLEHARDDVAVLVVDAIGQATSDGPYPDLLLAALGCGRKRVVAAAVRHVHKGNDEVRNAEIRRLLDMVFSGDDGELTLAAAYPLMQAFEHAKATDYLLAQLASDDGDRVKQVLERFGDSSNLGKPASAKMVDAFGPLLDSKSTTLRRSALRALSMYSGPMVVDRLIPLLGDRNASIATEVRYRLMHQRDKDMLRRHLTAAAKTDADETVRDRAAAVLQMLAVAD